MACSISWFDPRDCSIYGYINNQIYSKLSENVAVFKAKMFHANASITEKKVRKVFQNIANRPLYFAQMAVSFNTY